MLKTSFYIAFSLVATRILGLWRQHEFASLFGLTSQTPLFHADILNAAFRVPDLVLNLLSLGAITSVLIPFFAQNKEQARSLHVLFLLLFWVGLVGLASVAFLFPQLWISVLWQHFAPDQQQLLISITSLLLLSPLFLWLTAILGSFLQYRESYQAFVWSPLLYNGFVLGATLLFGSQWGILAPAYGAVLGAAWGLVWHIFWALRLQAFAAPTWADWRFVPSFFFRLVPRMLSFGGLQMALFFETAWITSLGAGMLTAFAFADSLQNLPVAVVGIALSLPTLPLLSRWFVQKESDKIVSFLSSLQTRIVYLSLFCMILTFVCAGPAVELFLVSGSFTSRDALLVSSLLQAFCLSFLFQSVLPLFQRVMFAQGKTWLPLAVTILWSAVHITLVFVLIHLFGLFASALWLFVSTLLQAVLYLILSPELRKSFPIVQTAHACLIAGITFVTVSVLFEFFPLSFATSWYTFCSLATYGLIITCLFYGLLGSARKHFLFV